LRAILEMVENIPDSPRPSGQDLPMLRISSSSIGPKNIASVIAAPFGWYWQPPFPLPSKDRH
jgi:hypothetical protein